jgi:murein DD-endopeptidase MepM/ murein hydrolase activator NlpD
VSTPEHTEINKTSASGLSKKFEDWAQLIYAVCYLVGARIIRFFRRTRRRIKRTALHTKWAVRRWYFDFKEQRTVVASTEVKWKRKWQDAFAQTRSALLDWNKQRQTGGLHLEGLLAALAPSVKMLGLAVNYLLPLAGIIILTATIHHFSTLTFGLRVQYNGEHIGYILSENDFAQAEAKVKERIVNETYLPPEDSVPIYSLEVVEDDQISEQSVLVNNIIRASGNEIEEAAGLYVDDQFIGAVENGDELLMSLKSRKDGTYQPGGSLPNESSAEEESPVEDSDSEPEKQPEESDKPQKQPASTAIQKTYTIQEGDSPWSIANEFGISTQDIIDLNPEVSKTMRVGEVLILSKESVSIPSPETDSESEEQPEPEKEEEPEEEPEAEDTASSEQTDTPSQKTYTIQEGDSPWSIANEFGISTQDIIDLNPEVSKTMKVGEVLILPEGDSEDAEPEEEAEGDQIEADAEPQRKPSNPNETVSFVQSIRLEQGLYPVSSIETLDSINQKLDQVVAGEQTYTIRQGDSPWSIADQFDISTQTLVNLNPEVSKTMLVGQTFIISKEQPFLQTKVVRTVTEEVAIDFETKTEVDQNKEKSYQKVIQEGKKGLEEVTSEVTYIDGYETERTVVSRTVLAEPVDAEIVVGSLTNSGYNFSGSGSASTQSNVGGYIWPVNGGYISCAIWGYSGHTGTDIAAPSGTTIWAAKGGTVSYAGWSNGYGYNILIDHGDGTKTRYAHCSSLAVYSGQQVSQGQVIGYVGRTGWATGNHCHFEIINNGRFLDARNYIGYSR